MDWTAIGTAAATLSAVGTGAWAWWLKNRQATANTRAEVAESDAQRAVADSQMTIYKLLNERLTTLESEVRGLRLELAAERQHSRKLELQLQKLDRWIRARGLEPPAFEEGTP